MSLLTLRTNAAYVRSMTKPQSTTTGVVAYEADCRKCGETFNPDGPDDLIHVADEYGNECGGKGWLVGSWS